MVENKESKLPGETPEDKKDKKPKGERGKAKSKKEFSEEKREEDKSSERKQGPTYQEIIQEIRKAEGKKLFPKDKTEKKEAERQLEELGKKRKEYQQIAQGLGLYQEVDKRIKNIREMSSKGKMFFANLNEEARASFELDGIPPELQGIAQEYYHQEILKIIGEKLAPEELEEQKKILREYLKVLRTGRLAPELITSNPLWIEMTSLVPYFKPELQEEFKARFEIFRYTLGFKIANGVESGIAGASGVLLPHIGKTLKVPEIRKAYDLLEESSQITIGEIMERKDIFNKDEAKEQIKKENPLHAGAEVQKKELFVNLALKLAEAFGEKTEGLNDKEKKDLAEKYMWAVEEADDVWRITFRSDESDIGMEGMGGQWYLNRLFHYAKRLERKGFGYESTRKYFNKPFLPVWIEGEPILPILNRKGELEIGDADIRILRERLKTKGLNKEEIEKRIRIIERMPLEGRGLMMQGLWEYQIDHLKIAGLLRLKFVKDGEAKITKDGNGRELPYLTYKRKFTSPGGEEKEMVVRVSIFVKDKHALKDEDKYGYGNVIEIANPSAEILSEICQQVPEGFYGSYVGDWIVKVDNTKKLLEDGVLKIPPGSEENIERLLSDLRSKKLFDHLDPLSKDKERKPGKYYQEDAWEDFLRGAVDFGLHEGKHMFEQWKIWGAWRAGVLTKKATDLKVITNEQGTKIENEMLTFLGMRGNIPRLLRCNFDRFTMVYRWGPMRGMLLAEIIKQFFQGILPELPSAPRKK